MRGALLAALAWVAAGLDGPAAGQGAPTPAAADAVACLAAVDGLPAEYRSVLQAQCVRTALSLCLARPGAVLCIDGLIGAYRDRFYGMRADLPEAIPEGGYPPRLYRNTLRRIDSTFGATRPCGDLSEMERARCRYFDIARATVDLFNAARIASVADDADAKP